MAAPHGQPNGDADTSSTCSTWSSSCSAASSSERAVVEVDGGGDGLRFQSAVSVESSHDFHFGNTLHYHGPVTLHVKDVLPLPPLPPQRFDASGRAPLRRWWIPRAAVVAAGVVVAVVIVTTLLLGKSPSGGGPDDVTEVPDITSPIPQDVQYVPKEQWGARPAKNATRLATPVDTVTVCHTATESCSSAASCSNKVMAMQRYSMDHNGWDDIGYNFLVGGDGRVYEGRGWDTVGKFVHGWDSQSLGVAVIGTFTEEMPPAEQRQQLASLLVWGVDLGKMEPQYRLVGACQLHSTKSPGLRFMQELRRWSRWWDYGAARCSE